MNPTITKMEHFVIIINGFSPSQLLQRAPSYLLWDSWIRLSTVINMICSIAKAVGWFKPERIVMHACLWGKYLNKLEKLMSWSLISLNLQYYNHSLLSSNHSQVIHSLPWKANYEITFLGQSFRFYLRKLQNIIVLLDLSLFYKHISSKW